ncbi:endo alpha-1,4 polygalactosaminidase [Frondihabitans sp. VKM Ac-2883]|uniref:endo alpha-1,4 polygalactosaminidase n=1 Tax=Frondihabitans sp. VKM Ac-2883 TaxID=2783823 RepID=UPI001E6212C7|nr:endo alpha-1,4 polygalactosaminidase [Frondihabitans sp. VKM Ac-2883]
MRALRLRRTKTMLATTAVVTALIGVASTGMAAQAATPVLPPVNGQFDYQIGGAYTPSSTVSIVDRDRSANPVSGKYNICYVNAFQTQPGEKTFWTGSHSDLLLKNSNGSYVEDPDWPGEYLLDTSTASKRTSIAGIINEWIDGCQSKGYQAVEPDNLDSWTRSSGKLTKANAVAYATLLTTRAHADGLAIAQKNTTELDSAGKNTVKFDFAIAEECQFNTECDAYTSVYGNNVIEIEYTDNARSAYTAACATQGKTISVILRDRDVVPSGDSAYRYEYC